MIRRTITSSVVAVVVACAVPAAAQDHRGFWGEGGLGVGSHAVSVADDSPNELFDGRDWGGVSELAVGWAVNRRWLVGFDMKATAGTITSDVDFGLFTFCGALWVYPGPANLFIKAGVGGSAIDATAAVGTSTLTETHGGLAATGGVGYELYLGRRLSLTPAVGFWYASPGDVRLAGQTLVTGWKHNAVDFTVALRFD